MYLTFGGDIKLDRFEINTTCSSWFHTNVAQIENKKRTLFSSHEYHVYKNKKVIGYIQDSAIELDNVVKDIVNSTYHDLN
jgi:hypothetical protein